MGGWGNEESFSDYTVLYELWLKIAQFSHFCAVQAQTFEPILFSFLIFSAGGVGGTSGNFQTMDFLARISWPSA